MKITTLLLKISLGALLPFFLASPIFAADDDSDDASGQLSPSQAKPSPSANTYDPLADLPYADIAPEDLRSYEKRKLVREILKRLDSHAKATEMLAERLEDLEQKDVAKILAEKFSFISPKNSTKTSASSSSKNTASKSSASDSNDGSTDMPIEGPDGEFDVRDGVLIVKTPKGQATAFVAEMKGKYFIITNLHVVIDSSDMTFTTVTGVSIPVPNTGFTSEGRDIYIMPVLSVPDGVKALPMSEVITLDVKDGDDAMVCGNAQGGGVLTVSSGKIMAIGPDRLETSCAIFRGNSGSPIYHKKSKKIIGVISHASIVNDDLTKITRERSNSPIKTEARYFGFRMDSAKTWQQISPEEIALQHSELASFINKIQCGHSFKGYQRNTITINYDYPEFEKIIAKYRNVVGGRGGQMDKIANRDMYTELARLMGSEVAKLKTRKFCDAFKPNVESMIELFGSLRDYYISRSKD